MRRSLTVPTVLFTVVLLIAVGCTSGDDTAEEPTTEAPAATVAAPETVTTVTSTTTTMEPTTTAVDDERIFGIWITPLGAFKEYRTDGTFGVGDSVEQAQNYPSTFGTYTFDGGTLTYHPDGRSSSCRTYDRATREWVGQVGVHEVTFSDDGTEQFRTVVDDPCEKRAREASPKLTRHSE